MLCDFTDHICSWHLTFHPPSPPSCPWQLTSRRLRAQSSPALDGSWTFDTDTAMCSLQPRDAACIGRRSHHAPMCGHSSAQAQLAATSTTGPPQPAAVGPAVQAQAGPGSACSTHHQHTPTSNPDTHLHHSSSRSSSSTAGAHTIPHPSCNTNTPRRCSDPTIQLSHACSSTAPSTA